MSRLRRVSRGGRLLLALAVGGAVFGIATAVQADIPDNGVIHGCYGKPGTTYKGQLRVRDASQGEQCRFYENQLDWNQTGPTGATGPTGPTGAAGVSGYEVVTQFKNGTGQIVNGEAFCPAGKVVWGGGATVTGLINNSNGSQDGLGPHLSASDIDTVSNGWAATAVAAASYAGQFNLTIHAICAKAS